MTFRLPPGADPEAIFELVDDPADGYCAAGMRADFDTWTLTVALPDASPLEQARWVRRLAEQGLILRHR